MVASDDIPTSSAALDYAWKRYTYRHSNAVQIVNFSLVASAILSAGYVTAVTNDRFEVAAALSFAGVAIALVAVIGYRAQVREAAAAAISLHALEERMSDLIELRSFADKSLHENRGIERRAIVVVMTTAYYLAAFAGLLSGISALLMI